jgi:small subunit ribosomal protein S13
MRIAGTNIPNEKRVDASLSYIYGIGPTLAKKVLKAAGVDAATRVKDLTNDEQDKLRAIVEKGYRTEGDLRREVQGNIKRLKDIKCYRGLRHMKHLPVRGQRTKTNSRTVRGNTRKTMGSGRKDAGQKT